MAGDELSGGRAPENRGRFPVRAVVVVTLWIAILAGLGYYSARRDEPTAPEQATAAMTLRDLNAAVADLVVALDPGQAIVTVGGLRRVASDCRITAAKTGFRYAKEILALTPAGQEKPMLDRVLARLPRGYSPIVVRGRSATGFSATGKGYIKIKGIVEAPGRIRITADAGCRPVTLSEPEPAGTTAPDEARRLGEALLADSGLASSGIRATRTTCPGRDPLWTVETTAAGATEAARARLVRAARRVPGPATVVLDRDDLVAYRTAGPGGGGNAVVVRSAGSVTVTAGCGN